MDLPLNFWVLATVGVIITGISKSGFAGGAGVLAIPLMAAVIPVTQALVIMLPLLLIMDALAIRYYWRHADFRLLRHLLPAALLGVIAGGLILGTVSDTLLELSLASISILFACWQKIAPLLSNFRGSAWVWGSVSGLSSTLIHAGGPPLNLYLMSRKLDKLTWLASASVFFGCMNLVKIIPYSLSHGFRLADLLIAACLIPVAFFGIYIGKQLQHRINEEHFILICRILLLISGLGLLYKALG